MSWSRIKVNLPQPVAAMQVRSFDSAPIPPREAEERVQAAYRKGQGEADDFHRQQLMEQREETVQYQREVLMRLEQKIDTLLQASSERIPSLVFALVERVLTGVTLEESALRELVLATLSELHHREGEHLEVVLSAEDHDKLVHLQAEGGGELQRLQFAVDERLRHGDVQVRSRFGLLDARLETKLAKIQRETLGT